MIIILVALLLFGRTEKYIEKLLLRPRGGLSVVGQSMALDTILAVVSITLGSGPAYLVSELRGLMATDHDGSAGTKGVLIEGGKSRHQSTWKLTMHFPAKSEVPGIGSCTHMRRTLSDTMWEEGSSETRWN